jgi:LysR family transcriptional regulator, regulator for bpeEF and oprC
MQSMFTQWMRAFVAVAEADSFSIASQRLGITQSTVSKQVAALELHLRTRLLNRTTRSLTLTSEGTLFYEAALRALAAIDEAEGSVTGGGDAQGLLRLTMPLTLSEARMMPIIADFLAAHPRIEIDLRLSDHALNLVADNIDVALRVGRLVDSGLVVRKIGVARRVIVASPAYLARAGHPAALTDLATHNCLAYSLLSSGPRWSFTNGESVAVSGNFCADSPHALRAAALAGIGIALNACWLFERELAEGTLVRVLPDHSPAPMPIHAVLPSVRHVAARTRLFIEHVAAAFARDPLLALD